MPNNNLILRSVVSPWITPTPDFTRNSVLSFSDVDNNFIYLKGELINSIETSGNTITLKKINGNDLSFNVDSGGGSDYWTSGSTGFYSIKTTNDSGLDATGNYSVASGFNTLSIGNVSFTHSTNSTASSDYTSILGGQNNEITSSSNNSSIVGGTGNTIGGSINGHILGGYDNSVNKNSDLSVVIAGSGNTIGNGSSYSSIINGFGNEIGISNHSYSSILGGQNNQIGSIESNNTSIIGGYSNLVQGADNSLLAGGTGNTLINSDYSSIIGGYGGAIQNSNNSHVLGLSKGNQIPYIKGSFNSVIFGGEDHQINDSYNSALIAGQDNDIKSAGGNELFYDSSIIGGQNNVLFVAGERSSILGGGNNQIVGEYNTSLSAITTTDNTIVGGSANTVSFSVRSGVFNGITNVLNGGNGNNLIYNSNIIGGDTNQINNAQSNSSIIGGSGNTISGYYSSGIRGTDNAIIGGVGNEMLHIDRSAIIAGTDNYMEAEGGIMNSVIAGGKDNKIDLVVGNEDGSFIAGGHSNTISGFVPGDLPIISSIIGGSGNTIDSISNSHIIGTFDVTATTENTLYVPNLEVRGQAYTPIYDNLTGGTTFIPDWDNSNVQILTLSGNTNVSGGTSTMEGGSAYTVIVKQSNGGSHTITWDSTYKWEAGSPPTLSVADGSVDIITFICDGTSLYGLIAKDFQ